MLRSLNSRKPRPIFNIGILVRICEPYHPYSGRVGRITDVYGPFGYIVTLDFRNVSSEHIFAPQYLIKVCGKKNEICI